MFTKLNKTFITVTLSALVAGTPSQAYEIAKAPARTQLSENRQLLQKMSRGVSELAAEANKAVVFVSVSKTIRGMPFGEINPFDFFFGPQYRGGPRQQQHRNSKVHQNQRR